MQPSPQAHIPDDLVPNRTGYTNDQLAFRTVVEVVSALVMGSGHGAADQRHADAQRRWMLDSLRDALLLTEPD